MASIFFWLESSKTLLTSIAKMAISVGDGMARVATTGGGEVSVDPDIQIGDHIRNGQTIKNQGTVDAPVFLV